MDEGAIHFPLDLKNNTAIITQQGFYIFYQWKRGYLHCSSNPLPPLQKNRNLTSQELAGPNQNTAIMITIKTLVIIGYWTYHPSEFTL